MIKNKNEGLIIDPGDEVDKILDMIEDTKILAILITHAHFDHIGALNDLLKVIDVPVYYNNVNNEIKNVINVKEKKYNIGEFNFEVIFTPGHRNDSVCYYFYNDNFMVTGDFLFHLNIGRTDLEYGDYNEMIKSINKIKKYDDNIDIYPGHGIKTNLGFEKSEGILYV